MTECSQCGNDYDDDQLTYDSHTDAPWCEGCQDRSDDRFEQMKDEMGITAAWRELNE